MSQSQIPKRDHCRCYQTYYYDGFIHKLVIKTTPDISTYSLLIKAAQTAYILNIRSAASLTGGQSDHIFPVHIILLLLAVFIISLRGIHPLHYLYKWQKAACNTPLFSKVVNQYHFITDPVHSF